MNEKFVPIPSLAAKRALIEFYESVDVLEGSGDWHYDVDAPWRRMWQQEFMQEAESGVRAGNWWKSLAEHPCTMARDLLGRVGSEDTAYLRAMYRTAGVLLREIWQIYD